MRDIVTLSDANTAGGAVLHHDGVRTVLHHPPFPGGLDGCLVGEHHVAFTDAAMQRARRAVASLVKQFVLRKS